MSFTHLHVHAQHSLYDGHGTIKRYVAAAAADGQTALALTDHGTMAGAVEFYTECKAAGIKPIIGCEMYVDFETLREQNIPYHLTVLAASEAGYRALMAVNTLAHRQFYYRPRLLLKDLLGHSSEFVLLTGCPSSLLSHFLKQGERDLAATYLGELRRAAKFVGIEVMRHAGHQEEFAAMQAMLQQEQEAMAAVTGLPLVLTNDCHYVAASDEQVHQAHVQNVKAREPKAVSDIEFDGAGFHLNTQAQMAQVATD